VRLGLDSLDMSKTKRVIALYISAGALAGFVLWFVGFAYANGQLDELSQFLIDRREGAGQTQPDRGATCLYDVQKTALLVTRKAHGQTTTEPHQLSDTLVEPHFAGQQALIETATTADTYNCINGEFLSHALAADRGEPIGRVLFSGTGRTLAATLLIGGREQAVEVFSFKANPGDSKWNDTFTPVRGKILDIKLVGESLVIATPGISGTAIHTYNFRSGHKTMPYNEFSLEAKPFSPPGQFVGELRMLNRGKQVELDARTDGKTTTYAFDFTCRQDPKSTIENNDKPCAWQAR